MAGLPSTNAMEASIPNDSKEPLVRSGKKGSKGTEKRPVKEAVPVELTHSEGCHAVGDVVRAESVTTGVLEKAGDNGKVKVAWLNWMSKELEAILPERGGLASWVAVIAPDAMFDACTALGASWLAVMAPSGTFSAKTA